MSCPTNTIGTTSEGYHAGQIDTQVAVTAAHGQRCRKPPSSRRTDSERPHRRPLPNTVENIDRTPGTAHILTTAHQITHFHGVSGPLPNAWFLRSTRVHVQNRTSIGSAVFAGLTSLITSTFRHHVIALQLRLLSLPASPSPSNTPAPAEAAEVTSGQRQHCRDVPKTALSFGGNPGPHLMRGSRGPPEFTFQTASPSVPPF